MFVLKNIAFFRRSTLKIGFRSLIICICLFFEQSVFSKSTHEETNNNSSSYECKDSFSVDRISPQFDIVGRQYRVEKVGVHQAYSLDIVGTDDIWSNSFSLNGEESSKAFWKDILFFSSEVMAIYRVRKAHLGYVFLSKWAVDVQENQYNSSLVTVYKKGEDIDAVVGTVRFIESDARGKLPLEKFLDIGLKTDGFEKYEIGLLTVEKILKVKERHRVLLELWIHLVNFFKDQNKSRLRVYAFADQFCTKLYKTWGFKPIDYFYKHGVLVENNNENRDFLRLVGGYKMEVLTFELSKESLITLLDRATQGVLTLDSDMVKKRLQEAGLLTMFFN